MPIRIRRAGSEPGLVSALAEVLIDCVEGGASVGFMAPLDQSRAEAFWADMLDSADRGDRLILIAEQIEPSPRLVGTVSPASLVGTVSPASLVGTVSPASLVGTVSPASLVGTVSPASLVGTVQVVLAQPENQPHRGDIAKLLVKRAERRRGIAEQLMERAEAEAAAAGKSLLVLDTASGDAERLYVRRGWRRVGEIPGYALWPDGRPCPTTIFDKWLDQVG